MPYVTPQDLVRELREIKNRVGITDDPEPTQSPSYRGEPRDAQLLLFQGPPAPLAETPGRWRPRTMSGDATIDDEGVITVTGGAGTFPIVYDDGTYTYEITATGADLTIRVTENADPTQLGETVVSSSGIFMDGNLAVDIAANGSGGVIDIAANDDGIISLAAGDVVEINTSLGHGDVSIGAEGKTVDFTSDRVRFFQSAAPANGDMSNSSFALWLDDTPGTTSLRVKAKDSAGTVRAATIPLL